MRTEYTTFESLNNRLAHRQKLKVGNNTYAVRLRTGLIAVRLHDTYVVILSPRFIVLNTGGWITATTKDRLNTYMPKGWSVVQERGLWYLRHWVDTSGKGVCVSVSAGFRDGITLEQTEIGWMLAQDSNRVSR